MKFPFPLTDQILDAYQAHVAYISAGQKWLLRNDPEGHHEQVLLEAIQTAIKQAAQAHFGDDEDAEYDFYDEFEMDSLGNGPWYECIENARMTVGEFMDYIDELARDNSDILDLTLDGLVINKKVVNLEVAQ